MLSTAISRTARLTVRDLPDPLTESAAATRRRHFILLTMPRVKHRLDTNKTVDFDSLSMDIAFWPADESPLPLFATNCHVTQ
jgi:hypothetical protein